LFVLPFLLLFISLSPSLKVGNHPLKDVLFGARDPVFAPPEAVTWTPIDLQMNDSQRDAIR
jgi:hypothetical protein